MSDKNTEINAKNEDSKKSKKKMSLLAKILFGIAGAIVFLVIIVVCYILHLLSLPDIVPDDGTPAYNVTTTNQLMQTTYNGTDVTETTSTEETTEDLSHLQEITIPSTIEGENTGRETAVFRTEKNVYNIILLGIDPTEGLADTMIVATINHNNNTIKLTSFMRDLFIENIEGYNPNRLNTVYKNGGMKLLKQVFKENFGIELYGFVSVDYNILVDVVDALGGVEMYISEAEANFLNTSNYIKDEASRNLLPGQTQQMNGYQVVGYCRLRYVKHGGENDDFARTRRQRETLIAIYDKFRNSSALTIMGLLEKVLPLVTTDLDQSEILTMAAKVLAGTRNDIEEMRIPIKGTYGEYKYTPPGATRYKSVIAWDMEKNVNAIHDFMYGAND